MCIQDHFSQETSVPLPSMAFNLRTLPGHVIIEGLLAVGWHENIAKANKFIGEKSTQSVDTQRWLILAQEIPQLGIARVRDLVSGKSRSLGGGVGMNPGQPFGFL